MHSKLIVLLLQCALAILPMQFAFAQQPQTDSIDQLKEQIRRMETVDRDPSTPDEVRNLNRQFLNARRQQLRDLVAKRINELRAYQMKMDSVLSGDEKRLIESSIEQLEASVRDQENLPGTSEKPLDRPSRVNANGSESNGTEARGTNINSPARNSDSSVAPAATSPAPQAPCKGGYPNVPPRLDKMVEAMALLVIAQAVEDRAASPATAATQFAKDIAGEFERHYDEAVYLTIADALFTDVEKVNLTKLRWQQFSAETRRTDKQIGASARSAGSTSVIEKPNFADLLSFAIEHGAIQKEVDQTSLTLSTSPYALIASIHGDTSDVYQQYDFFNRIGISANFNLANQDNVLANASRKQLNQWSVKLRLNPDRTARGRDFQKYWDANVLPKIERRAIVLTGGLNDAFNNVPALGRLRRSVRTSFEGTNGYLMTVLNSTAAASQANQATALKQEILCRLKAEVYDPIKSGTIPVDASLRASINKTIADFAAAQLEAEEGRDDVRAEIKRLDDKPTASISYTNVRPATGSYYSVFKGLYLQKAFAPMKIVANGEFSIYHNPDPVLRQQRLRDALFSVALEGKLGRSPFVTTTMDESPITFSFTGSYQRMLENTKGFNKKADIGSGQLKLEIPVFTGFSLPLAVTYSNATEEQKKRHFRFNFGFGLDADKLAALLLAKKALSH